VAEAILGIGTDARTPVHLFAEAIP
jgi:hypothetical protein